MQLNFNLLGEWEESLNNRKIWYYDDIIINSLFKNTYLHLNLYFTFSSNKDWQQNQVEQKWFQTV